MYKIINNIDGSQCVQYHKENNLVIIMPVDENNSDYQEYLAWLEKGNEPEIMDLT